MTAQNRMWIVAGLVASAATVAAAKNTPVSGEGNAVSGQVVDASTHSVLDGVRVSVKGTGLNGKTAEDGTFFFENVPGTEVSLQMSRAGYNSREIDIMVSATPTKWTVALWKSRR